MPNTEHLSIFNKGVDYWNEWRIDNPEKAPDLSWSSLPGLDLTGINLENSNLKLAFCRGCKFINANLKNVTLFGANLESCAFSHSDMSNADLEGALLKNATISNSRLTDCNFRLANLEGVVFENSDIIGVKKLKYNQLSLVKSIINSSMDAQLREKIIELKPFILDGS